MSLGEGSRPLQEEWIKVDLATSNQTLQMTFGRRHLINKTESKSKNVKCIFPEWTLIDSNLSYKLYNSSPPIGMRYQMDKLRNISRMTTLSTLKHGNRSSTWKELKVPAVSWKINGSKCGLGLMKVVFNFTHPYASFHSAKTKCIYKSCPISVMMFLQKVLHSTKHYLSIQLAYICMLNHRTKINWQTIQLKEGYILQ